MSGRRPLLLVAAIVAGGITPAVASAQWTPAEALTPGSVNGRFPDVAVNARGDAVAAWITTGRSGRSAIRVSIRPAGGAWSTPRTVSRTGRSARDPQVAINDAREVVVAWRRVARTRRVNTGSGLKPQAVYVVQARRRTVDGPWQPTQNLSSSRQKSGPPRLGLDETGKAVVVWHWGTGTAPGSPGFVSRVQSSTGRTGSRFTGARRLSRRSGCGQAVGLPDVAVGASGDAVAWWECRRNRRGDISVDYSTLTARGTRFGTNRRLAGISRGAPEIAGAVAGDGSIRLAVTRGDGDRRGPRVMSAQRSGATGPLGAPRSIRGARGEALAAAGRVSGDVLMAWSGPQARRSRSAPLVAVSRAARAATFGPTELLRSPRRISDTRAVLGRDGAAAVAWIEGVGRREYVVAAIRPDTTRPWERGSRLSTPGEIDRTEPLALAGDGAGNLVALWTRRDGDRFRIERAEYRAPSTASRR